MKPRHKRLALILGGLAVLGVAATLVLSAFQENLVHIDGGKVYRTAAEVCQ